MNNEIPLPKNEPENGKQPLPNPKDIETPLTVKNKQTLTHLSRRQVERLFFKMMGAFEKQSNALMAYTKMCEMLLGTLYAIYPQNEIFNEQNLHINLLNSAKKIAEDMKAEEGLKENGIWTVNFKNKTGQNLHTNSFELIKKE